MRALGASDEEIAAILQRTPNSVKFRFYWDGMTEEERTARRSRMRELTVGALLQIVKFDPSPDALADRDYRATLVPESLTSALMGDPLRGYSARDRRSG